MRAAGLDALRAIGDAAHAMSLVAGVGINLAIQAAVVTGNLPGVTRTRTPEPADRATLRSFSQGTSNCGQENTMPTRRTSQMVHLRGERSAGQLALVELIIAAGAAGPPLRIHPGHAEGFHILEGKLILQVRDELVTGHAGDFFFAPAGTPHTFANPGRSDARLLVTCNPAQFEHWFEPSAEFADSPPPDSEAVGPPIGASAGTDAVSK